MFMLRIHTKVNHASQTSAATEAPPSRSDATRQERRAKRRQRMKMSASFHAVLGTLTLSCSFMALLMAVRRQTGYVCSTIRRTEVVRLESSAFPFLFNDKTHYTTLTVLSFLLLYYIKRI